MALPEFSMRQLLEAGVHFGHQTHRWNPKMAPYIFGARSNIHIMDLSQTVPLLHQALVQAREVASKGGRILFVGTKRAASEPIATAAQRCAQYYVNHRWLGGMLTNWQTVSGSIKRLRELETMLGDASASGLTKKELLQLTREQGKLDKALGGIKDMGGKPDLMFIIDTNKESIAIKEARRLNIPVIAILDTNCDPSAADFPIPGNDDAARAISLYCDLLADAILDGMTESAASMGMDLGAAENPVEVALDLPEAAPAPAPAVAAAAASKPEVAPAFVDDVSLIDGVGPTYKEKLASIGVTSLKQIADMDASAITAAEEKLSLAGKFAAGEWVEQAKELIAGKPPRAKVDQAAAAKA